MRLNGRCAALLAALATVGLPCQARAQKGIGPEIQQVFQQTKSAKSAEDYGQIIEQCQQLKEQTDNEARRQYLDRLLAWALNRRGETHAKQAAETKDLQAAARLDELALADFQAAVEHDAQRWKAVHNRGVSYALMGRHEEAEADFTRTIELRPNYANAWFNRAEIRRETGRIELAHADYQQMLDLAPEDAGGYRGRAHCRQQLGRHLQAVADYTRTLKLAANDAETFADRGEAYQSLGQWKAAASDFRQAISLDNSSARAYQSAAWLMCTCPDERYRNGKLAVEAAEKALALEREQLGQATARTLDTLAAAYANAGQGEKAAEHARQALEQAGGLDEASRDAIGRRLQLYQQGRPYRLAASQGERARR